MTKTLSGLVIALILASTSQCANAQGMFEVKGISALSAGAGAGVAAAAAGNKKSTSSGLTALDLSKVLGNGDSFAKQGKWADAEKCYRYGLTSFSKLGKVDSPEGVTLLRSLASSCEHQKKFGDAAGFYKTVVASQQRHSGENAPETVDAKQHLASILVESGDFSNAASYFGQALASIEASGLPQPQDKMLRLMDNCGNALRHAGRDADAQAMETKANNLRGTQSESKSQPIGTENAGAQKGIN